MNPLASTIITWCLVAMVACLALLVAIGIICLMVIVITACAGAARNVWLESQKEKKATYRETILREKPVAYYPLGEVEEEKK